MEQTKALNALEPFLALSKSAISPRAAIDLIRQATSAPNTYIFGELLQTPSITSLSSPTSSDPDQNAHHTLLRVFSHGTYADYISTPNLPELSEAQILKLRQLSLLTLARDRRNLSYAALQENLGLNSPREVEDVVVTAIYAGLLNATLDPARQAVQVTSIAPLRDLAPGAVPEMISVLGVWNERCASTLGDIDTRIQTIRAKAAAREQQKRKAEEKLNRAANDLSEGGEGRGEGRGENTHHGSKRDLATRRSRSTKRAQQASQDEESMDLDDVEEVEGRGNKRKL